MSPPKNPNNCDQNNKDKNNKRQPPPPPPKKKKEVRTCPKMRLFFLGEKGKTAFLEKKGANKRGKNKGNPRCLFGKNEEPLFCLCHFK